MTFDQPYTRLDTKILYLLFGMLGTGYLLYLFLTCLPDIDLQGNGDLLDFCIPIALQIKTGLTTGIGIGCPTIC